MRQFNKDIDLELLRRGDRFETERFVKREAGRMLSTARRIVRDASLAEDVVQNAFAAAFRGLEGFDGRSSLQTWLHRIVVNEALMVVRKSKQAGSDDLESLLPVFDHNGCRIGNDWATLATPESILQSAEAKQTVLELVDRIPEPYRMVLLLRDIEELSTAEVAELLAISQSNVKVRLHRARSALKKLLEPLMKGHAI